MNSSCYRRSPDKSRGNSGIFDIPFIGLSERLAKILSELCRVKIQARAVFRVEDTDGEPLDYQKMELPEFPLIEKAKEWGIFVKAVPGNYILVFPNS